MIRIHKNLLKMWYDLIFLEGSIGKIQSCVNRNDLRCFVFEQSFWKGWRSEIKSWWFRKKSQFVMPDLIRHPGHTEITGFRLSPEWRFKGFPTFYELIKVSMLWKPPVPRKTSQQSRKSCLKKISKYHGCPHVPSCQPKAPLLLLNALCYQFKGHQLIGG